MKKNALDLSQKQRHLPGSYQRKTVVVPQKIAKLGRLFNNLQLIHSFSNCIERNVNTQ